MPFDPNLYNEKYRIPSARAEWWEYGGGCYHVIIKTKFNRRYFGRIIRNSKTRQNEMIFSEIGKFANESISKISEHQWYAFVPVWSVMPDHIHLMVMIDVRGRHINEPESVDSIHAATGGVDKNIVSTKICSRDVPWNVSTTNYNTSNNPRTNTATDESDKYNTSNNPRTNTAIDESDIIAEIIEPTGNSANDRRTSELMSSISPKTGSLSLIIRQFKQSVTLYAKQHKIEFAWQPRFYDVIITKQFEFDRVWRYIENNVAKWRTD